MCAPGSAHSTSPPPGGSPAPHGGHPAGSQPCRRCRSRPPAQGTAACPQARGFFCRTQRVPVASTLLAAAIFWSYLLGGTFMEMSQLGHPRSCLWALGHFQLLAPRRTAAANVLALVSVGTCVPVSVGYKRQGGSRERGTRALRFREGKVPHGGAERLPAAGNEPGPPQPRRLASACQRFSSSSPS